MQDNIAPYYAFSFSRGPSRPAGDIRLGTLGPKTTSSWGAAEFVARRLRSHGYQAEVLGFPSFEDLRRSLDRGEVDVGVIPAAMRDANLFFFDPLLVAVANFQRALPVYGLIHNEAASAAGNRLLATREEPAPAIPFLLSALARPADVQVKVVGSTAEAAEQVANGAAAWGITNLPSAAEFHLKVIRQVPQVKMVWICFGHRNADLDAIPECLAV